MSQANAVAPLYLQVARDLEEQMQEGTFAVGDQVPSVRELSRQHRVSVSTVLQAYFWLENRGWLEARPKSGFYVRARGEDLRPEPAYRPVESSPKPVTLGELAVEVLQERSRPVKVSLGAACPDPEVMPNHKLNAILRRISREQPEHSTDYDRPPGNPVLRQQIAKRSLAFGCHFSYQDVILTCGAMEALNLCLRAAGQPGDVIAVESPTYFAILQAIESLGMKAVEIPTHYRTGMDLNALEHAIRKHKVRAVIALTNCHNPLGYVLSDDAKRALVELVTRHEVPLIEDDVYGDLAFAPQRPRIAKSFDRHGLVMVCSSFSKTIAPGLRAGWVHAERYRARIEQLKLITTLASPSLPAMVVAEFLESGGYDRHVRGLRLIFEQQVQTYSRAVSKYFPEGTRLSRPAGGYVLWVELPKRTDALGVYRAAMAHSISISPGPIFSASGKFTNCLRLNCGHRWTEEIDRALLKLGRICEAKARG